MHLRIEIDDVLYKEYKQIAEKRGYAVTKLNNIIFKECVERFVADNQGKQKTEK